MYETSDHLPVVTTQSLPIVSHHAPMDCEKQVDYLSRRTPSPTSSAVAKTLSESAMSPVATSSSSHSSPASQQPVYHEVPQQMAAIPPQVASSSFSQPQAHNPSSSATGSWGGSAITSSKQSDVSISYTASSLDSSGASQYPSTMTTYHNAPVPSSTTSGNTSIPVKQKTVVAAKKRYSKGGNRGGAVAGGSGNSGERSRGDSVTARRQKRLERNRESARLSRRRRKQYLEVLEDRVTQLSIEMDQGRREHAARAVETILQKRRDLFESNPTEQSLAVLDKSLHRISQELLVTSTFNIQQLKSFSLPAHTKFVLWLTLQGDTYFRGGRAASERLSAARIGERMLQSGTDKVPSAHSMWPLFCNEVGLSYDQEERVRNYQRTLLQTPTTWLDRHTGRSSGLLMQTFHDCFQAVAVRIRQKESDMLNKLTPTQRLKFHTWAEKNADRIKATMEKKNKENQKPKQPEKFELSKSHHIAANLYILNHKLHKVLTSTPRPMSFISAAYLKRLSRRPSFESLGQQKEEGNRMLSRDASFASSGSLKRSTSSASMDDQDKPHPQQVSPEDGQEAAMPTVEKELGFIKEIIPPPRAPVLPPAPQLAPPPTVPNPPVPAPAYRHYAPPAPATSHTVVTTHHGTPHPGTQMMHPTASAFAPPHAVPVAQHQPPVQHQVAAHPPPSTSTHSHTQMIHPHHTQQYYQHEQRQPHHHHPPPQHQQRQPHPQHQPPPQPQHPHHHHHHQQQQPHPEQPQQEARSHGRNPSFLPFLNAVPEEVIGSAGVEDFFMSLMDDSDWAIGEGIDMDTNA